MITITSKNGIWNLPSIEKEISAIQQEVETIIKLWTNDAFWDTENGINWHEYLGLSSSDTASISLLRSELLGKISSVNGVQMVKTLDFYFQTKSFIIKYNILTSYNNNIISEVNIWQ